jgi:hypothetical protein
MSGPRLHAAEPDCLMGLAGSGRRTLKRQNAIPVTPTLAGRRDSCLRSDPFSVKYIDLPECPELRSGHLNRSDRELSRENPFTLQSAIRHPVFSTFPENSSSLSSAASVLVCWNAGSLFVHFHAEALLSTPAILWLGTTRPGLKYSRPRLRKDPISTWYGRSFFSFSVFWNPFTQTFKLNELKTPTTEPGHIKSPSANGCQA